MKQLLPHPSARINKILRDRSSAIVSFGGNGVSDSGFGSGEFFKSHQYSFTAHKVGQKADILDLVGDDSPLRDMFKARIAARNAKQKRMEDHLFETLQAIFRLEQKWDWKFFGVRFGMLYRTIHNNGDGVTVANGVSHRSKIHSPSELKLEDVPSNSCLVMIFMGEEKARRAWDLTMAARASRAEA